MCALPELTEILPHRPPMVYLDRVVSFDEGEIVCAATVGAEPCLLPQNADGSIPTWLGLEYMAQTAAAYAGMCALRDKLPVRRGVLLGTRKLELFVPSLTAGRKLLVSALPQSEDEDMRIFECSIKDAASGELLAEGKINVLLLA